MWDAARRARKALHPSRATRASVRERGVQPRRRRSWRRRVCDQDGAAVGRADGPGSPRPARAIPTAFTSVAFSPDGTRVWRRRAGTRRRGCGTARRARPLCWTCKGHTGGVTSVAFSPDGTRLGAASDDKTAQAVGRPDGPATPDTARAIPARSRAWRSARTARAWRRRVMTRRRGVGRADGAASSWSSRATPAPSTSVAFSPDGTRLATASEDKTATAVGRARRARTPPGTARATPARRTSVAFSPDGTRLATASDDKTARLWDARTGQELLELQGPYRHR